MTVIEQRISWSDMDWPERLQMIRDHWEPGASATMIAASISEACNETISRNVIVGLYHRSRQRAKIHREPNPLDNCPLNPRGTHGISTGGFRTPRKKAPLPPKPRKAKSGAPEPDVSQWLKKEDPTAIPVGEYGSGIPLADLDGCKWATGNNGREHLFCGAARQVNSPYCEFHHGRAYVRVDK